MRKIKILLMMMAFLAVGLGFSLEVHAEPSYQNLYNNVIFDTTNSVGDVSLGSDSGAEEGPTQMTTGEKASEVLGNAKDIIDKGAEMADTLGDKTTKEALEKVSGPLGDAKDIVDLGNQYANNPYKSPTMEFIYNANSTVKAAWEVAGKLGVTPAEGGAEVLDKTDQLLGDEDFQDYMNEHPELTEKSDDEVAAGNAAVMDLFNPGSGKEYLEDYYENKAKWKYKVEKRTPDGVGSKKPNIYLYPVEDMEIEVEFTYPALLLKSIPTYTDVWKVIASTDGQLTFEDGSLYGYLFYESKTYEFLFDKEEGFVINTNTRKEQFEEIMKAYGFNETETADFVAYWCNELDADKDYVMYPQYSDTVDKAMPVVITPAPDTLYRLWFTFEKYEGQKIEKPTIIPFERIGYTAVEWGGVILDE